MELPAIFGIMDPWSFCLVLWSICMANACDPPRCASEGWGRMVAHLMHAEFLEYLISARDYH